MEIILKQLSQKTCLKSHLKTICRRNKVTPLLVESFTVIKFRKFYEKLGTIQISNKNRTKSSVWLENELRAYQWFLVAMSSSRKLPIERYGKQQWKQLSIIFNKEKTILEYEALRLIKQHTALKRCWQLEQTKLLQSIIAENTNNNKWNEIARKLFEQSQGAYFRTGKQCRERWLNHLDPIKKHGQWESAEDRKIVDSVLNIGKRWSQIARQLQNERTQHMVKNRFKTLTTMLRKKHKDLKSEKDLLIKFYSEEERQKSSASFLLPSVESYIQLEEGVPSIVEKNKQFSIVEQNIEDNNIFDHYLSAQKYEINQVSTPPVFTCHTYTTIPQNFLAHCSFGEFDKNELFF